MCSKASGAQYQEPASAAQREVTTVRVRPADSPPEMRDALTTVVVPQPGKDFKPNPHTSDTEPLQSATPAPQSAYDDSHPVERVFAPTSPDAIAEPAVEERIAKEVRFDPDAWIVEIEDKAGRHFLDLASK